MEGALGNKGTIAIVGAGLMGTAIATLCAAHGYRVTLTDQNPDMLGSFADRAAPIAKFLADEAGGTEAIFGRIACNPSLADSVAGAFLVQEAIHEDLDAKRALFRQLDAVCPPEAMLATNTSSYLLSEICGEIPGRRRTIGIHYVAPAHLIRAIEIITASFTDLALVDRAREFAHSIDHVGIVCRESPGFLINRIQYALKAELQRMLEERVASVEDLDAAVRLALGPRLALWGPLMQEDLSAGKKTVLSVMEYLHVSTGGAHFAGTDILRDLVERGDTGAPAGAGWYRWGGSHARRIEERDRQLGDLLDWLRDNDRLGELGAEGENPRLKKKVEGGSA
jgi:3-hydroxybutyryl-CoA dehydrogenase